jgi:hypothetical protein
MEKLLEKYLINYSDWGDIYIGDYYIDGAICSVTFYTDPSRYYKETTNINVWDMLMFLNSKNKQL